MSVLQSLSYIVRKVDAAISLGKRPPDHTSLSQTTSRACPSCFSSFYSKESAPCTMYESTF